MELSILIAKIIATVYLATGIALLNGGLNLKEAYKMMEKSRAITTYFGISVLVMGMLIIEYHNIWVKNWPVLITIIGWVLMAEGVFYVMAPKSLLNFFKSLPQSQIGWGILTLGMGFLFGYFGFYI